MIERFKNLFRKQGTVSDGHHTFDELYEHRIFLFLNMCINRKDAWWSKRHSDGKYCFGDQLPTGWVVVGIGKQSGYQITYHMKQTPEVNYFLFRFTELYCAPKFDGHTSEDVVKRLKTQIFGGL